MDFEHEQLTNLRIINNVLKSPKARHSITDFDFESLNDLVNVPNCKVLIISFNMLERIQNDIYLSQEYEPNRRETEVLKFIMGRFFNKVVFSCYGIPDDTFLMIEIQGDGTAEQSHTKVINVIV